MCQTTWESEDSVREAHGSLRYCYHCHPCFVNITPPSDTDEIVIVPETQLQGGCDPPTSCGVKTSGKDLSISSDDSTYDGNDIGPRDLLTEDIFADQDDDDIEILAEEKTNLEVSKYSFFDRLAHYMEGIPINEDNRKAVELAIMVEEGTTVREMSTMTKEMRAKIFYTEYQGLISEMPASRFVDGSVRRNMTERFKGMRDTEMNAENLLRKYEGEMTTLKKIVYTYLPSGNLSNLPCGTTQVQ